MRGAVTPRLSGSCRESADADGQQYDDRDRRRPRQVGHDKSLMDRRAAPRRCLGFNGKDVQVRFA